MKALLLSLLLTSGFSSVAASYPIKLDVSGRFLVDSNSNPYMMIGEHAASIAVHLNQADSAAYMHSRATNAFTTIWIQMLCDAYDTGPGNEGDSNYGHNLAGDNPFTATITGGYYDLTKPNDSYFSNIDFLIGAAATNGLLCLFTPLDNGGWTQTSIQNGSNACFLYGRWLASRYYGSNNVAWNMGNDFFNWANPTYSVPIMAIASGIRSVDSNHVMTVELGYVQLSTDSSDWGNRVAMNWVYSYNPTYYECWRGWGATNLPVLLGEGIYENESYAEPGTPQVMRKQDWWAVTSGALAGQLFGNQHVWPFDGNWPTGISDQGEQEFGYFGRMITNITWWELVPDEQHKLLAAGYGTAVTNTGTLAENNLATAAYAANGQLGLVYAPTNSTLTIAMTNFSGSVTCRWYDPTTNTFTSIAGSPFANTITTNLTTPGSNAAGDSDWVLLLQSWSSSGSGPSATGPISLSGSVIISGSGQWKIQ